VALVLAVALPDDQAAADSTSRPTAAAAALDGIQSEGAPDALDPRAVVVGGSRADVTVARHGYPAVTFVLRRASGADALAFGAPSAA
jgi:hypothetical protein